MGTYQTTEDEGKKSDANEDMIVNFCPLSSVL
jgi:hypothetical protein